MSSALVDSYLARCPSAFAAALEQLRATIQATVPEARECLSYQLPAFELALPKGRPRKLVAYGAAARHCALYPMDGGIVARFATELAGFSCSKGCIRFTPEHPLPNGLVVAIVKARLAQVRE